MYYLTVSVGQEFRSGLAGWVWLVVSTEIAGWMSAGAAVIWQLDWGWRVCFQGGSLAGLARRWSAGGFSSWPHGPLHSCLSGCRAGNPRDHKAETTMSFMTWRRKSHCHFCSILLVPQVSPIQWGRGLNKCGGNHWGPFWGLTTIPAVQWPS